jgi:hypothetical protein
MAKVYDIKTKQRRKVTRAEFFELLDTADRYIDHLQMIYPDRRINLNESKDIIAEMKFIAMFNPKFRDTNAQPLEDLLDYLYTRVHAE